MLADSAEGHLLIELPEDGNLDEAQLKVADFGFAKIASQLPTSANGQKLMMTSCGTPEYVAPEVLANTGYGVKCDVWSMGEWRRPTPQTRALHRVRWW